MHLFCIPTLFSSVTRYYCMLAKLFDFGDVFVTCGLSSFHKARKLAVTRDNAPVHSGCKPMNEDLNNVNKDTTESKSESKEITQDSRPKGGQTPKPYPSYQFNHHNLSGGSWN